jgi:adenylylsulfate reductase subunit A
MAYKTIVEDGIDILVAGAGLGGTGAAWEARFWGKDKKIVIAEKANIDRSGAVAQGLYAINCYMGTRWGENNPEDHVRYARIDLMCARTCCLTWPATSTARCTSSKSGACPS